MARTHRTTSKSGMARRTVCPASSWVNRSAHSTGAMAGTPGGRIGATGRAIYDKARPHPGRGRERTEGPGGSEIKNPPPGPGKGIGNQVRRGRLRGAAGEDALVVEDGVA